MTVQVLNRNGIVIAEHTFNFASQAKRYADTLAAEGLTVRLRPLID